MELSTVLERNHNKAVTAPIREMLGITLAEAAPDQGNADTTAY